MKGDWVTRELMEEARGRLADVTVRTPLQGSATFSRMTGMEVLLKPENLQKTGSFKVRGAYNRVSALAAGQAEPATGPVRGVITASSGNHGQAVAFSAARADLPAVVVMPRHASALKVEAARGYGAEVILHGEYPDQRRELARNLAADRSYVYVDSTDDLLVMAGQASVGLEILEEDPKIDAIVAPVGGGGLMSGLASAVKLTRPSVRVIGAEPRGAAAMHASLQAGAPVSLDRVESVADGLWARRPGDLCFAHVNRYVDDLVLVEEEEILDTLRLLGERAKLVVEPSGAVALAAALAGRVTVPGKDRPRVAFVLTGGNVARDAYAAWLVGNLTKFMP